MMTPSMLTSSSEGVLCRSEMKNVMAGGGSSCAIGCNDLYSGYHTECSSTYSHTSDEWGLCHDEVFELNMLCINDCF
jgi:hypothetical protein